MTNKQLKKIGIIIINYGEKSLIDTSACLKSLQDLEYKGFEYHNYVVTYGEESAENIHHFSSKISDQYPNTIIIEQKGNLGFAKANNIGVEKALADNCDYVLLLNNDTVAHSGFLENLFNYLEHNEEVGAISPKIYFAKGCEYHKTRYQDSQLGKVIWYAGGKIDWNNIYTPHIGVDAVDNDQYNNIFETDFISGCCVLLPRQVIEKVGMLNIDLFMYWEDIDLSKRIQDAGYKTIYYPQSHIWHKNAGSSGVGSALHDYFMTRNRLWFGMKYANSKTKFALFRESIKQLFSASDWIKKGVKDYYFGKMGKGSWK